MGEESKKFAPTCSAISTTARAFLLALSPLTSKVRHVPIPTTGTCKPVCPRFRLSMFLSFLVVIVALSLASLYTANNFRVELVLRNCATQHQFNPKIDQTYFFQ